MDAIDNPSYFTLPCDVRRKKSTFPFLRKRSDPSTKQITQSGSIAGIAALSSGRRNSRTLSRSISDDTHLLVLGKPRPSDMAPSVYSAQNIVRHHQHRRSATMPRHLMSSDGLLHQDMVLCGAVAPENDDVFTASQSPDNNGNKFNRKYYNLGPPVCATAGSWFESISRRRHSVGSVLQPNSAVNVNNGQSNNLASSAGGGTTAINIKATVEDGTKTNNFRRRCNKLLSDKTINGKFPDADDILLLSSCKSEAAGSWVKYLTTCFQQICKEQNRSPFRITQVYLEDILANGSTTLLKDAEKYSLSRLQIFIICPLFLQEIQKWPMQQEIPLGKIIHTDRAIAMLLGVTETAVMIQLKPVLPSYDHWRRMIVKDQDPTFVGDFLGVAMDIISRTWHLREAISTSDQGQASFSILPKKIKVGQNKLVLLLNEPLLADDVVKVFVEKNDHQTETVHTKRRNPYTLQFSIPVTCLQVSSLVNIRLEKNGKPLGKRVVKYESRMRELDQILRSVDNPMQFMCQSFNLNIADREQLDTALLAAFHRNMPPHFNLLHPPANRYQICNEEYPTLLHFSAKYGLDKLSWQLLESPGGEQACQLRNSSHLIPSEIAERAGHTKLASALKGYMQMTELSSLYNYLKGLEDKGDKSKTGSNGFINFTPSQSDDDGVYLLPKLLSETYLIPPAARPVNSAAVNQAATSPTSFSGPYYANFKPCNFTIPQPIVVPKRSSSENFLNDAGNYQVPRNGRPCTPQTPQSPTSPDSCKLGGYLEMTCSGHDIHNNFGSTSTFSTSEYQDNFSSFGKLDVGETGSVQTEDSHTVSSPSYRAHSRSAAREKLSADDELLEIINDFKNNVFSISEVEQLVQSWQNRNDVQQSFREKQEQLSKMREEYEKIQRRMKEQMKHPTPFEKIRRFFSRSKLKHTENSSRTSVSSDNSCTHRPSSSISLQSVSSGSSGRNSIESGGSVYFDSSQHHQSEEGSCGGKSKKPSAPKDIPRPPQYLNLSTTYDSSPSDYSPMDYSVCRSSTSIASTPTGAVNRLIGATIHEGLEIDEALRILRTIDTLDKKGTDNNNSRCPTLQNALSEKDKKKTNSYCNIQRIADNNGGTFDGNSDSVKSAVSAKKARSVENLLCDRSYANVSFGQTTSPMESKLANEMNVSSATLKNSSSPRLDACFSLCNESVKCLTGITIGLTSSFDNGGENPNDANDKRKEDECDELSFKCENVLNDIAAVTLKRSKSNSSLDRSSFSLNSTGSLDETKNADRRSSEQTNATTKEDCTGTADVDENQTQPSMFDVRQLPEYVNVTIPSAPPLPPRYLHMGVANGGQGRAAAPLEP